MYRPTKKSEHDESLKRFIKSFNEASPHDISMEMWREEGFIYDGDISLWGAVIPFDWEKRDDWEGERFPYPTLGQFERKFEVEKGIELTIQANRAETYFATAWHRDFEETVDVTRKTNFKHKEQGKMRTTQNFKVFNYSEMNQFKEWIFRTCGKTMPKLRLDAFMYSIPIDNLPQELFFKKRGKSTI